MGKNIQGTEPRKNFTVRLSEDELKTLKNNSSRYRLKPSDYIRKLIMSEGMIDISLPEQRRNLINQISRIGNNINQIAHMANSQGWIPSCDISQVTKLQQEIQDLMREVLQKWR